MNTEQNKPMNISDEYFTAEVPEGSDFCAIKRPSGIVEMCSIHAARVFAREPNAMGARFCRLAPAAEVERLKAENEKLREWIKEAYFDGWRDMRSGRVWEESASRSRLRGITA